jgi:AAA domain
LPAPPWTAGSGRWVTAFGCDPRLLLAGIGPAGSGKTTAMRALAHVLRDGGRRLVLLATSAASADVLGRELGVRAENLHKFLHEWTGGAFASRLRAGAGIPEKARMFRLHPGDTVLVDEAGMAGTFMLDKLVSLAAARGAAVRLLGDDRQLPAVEGGGALRLVAAQPGTPPVAPGTQPEVLVHMGFTSVYTVDQGSMHLQETYLSAFGDSWLTQDLTANPAYNAPVTDQSPIVLLHPDESGNMDWASVFTVDEFSNDLMETYLPNTGFPGDAWHTQDLSSDAPTMPQTPPVAVQQSSQATWLLAHDGYTSAFSVDGNGDLQESYLPAMSGAWTSHDLSSSTLASTPAVAPITAPVALYHQGYTSVFTVDGGTSHLQETWLPALGGSWFTHDLSSSAPGMASTPLVAPHTSPTVVYHDGFTSVYTIAYNGNPPGSIAGNNGDLQETFLPAIGDSWVTQDLTAKYGLPTADTGLDPVALYHAGYTSVYYESGSLNDMVEAFVPAISNDWTSNDLTANYQTPLSGVYPSPLVHYGFNGALTWTSVFTVDAGGNDLQETYLPEIGPGWTTQDLTHNYPIVPPW